jgi:mannosyltransferase OCH1-like enzyme
MFNGKIGITKITAQDIQNKLIKTAVEHTLQKKRILDYRLNKRHVYNSIIPLKIYQTWHTKNLPLLMKKNVELLKLLNPQFEHFLFDDDDCRNFIKDNFNERVLHAFDSLIPGAYKADLWRYCILYINGGYYLDIKYQCVNNFKFIELSENEQWVLDNDGSNIYNAFIVAMPQNKTLLACINKIVDNVKSKYYGGCCLDPTGPGLVSQIISQDERKSITLKHLWDIKYGNKFILYHDIAILKMYDGFYDEQNAYKKTHHYSELWGRKKIYKR